MNEHMSDERLLELLGRGLTERDPVPEAALGAARAAFTWRTIDAELAELVFDSEEAGLAGVRGASERQVTFRAPGVEIEVMVATAERRRLVGQLVPPQQATVELHTAAGVREQGTDSLGRFSFDDVSPGPVKLTVQTEPGGTVATEWMVM